MISALQTCFRIIMKDNPSPAITVSLFFWFSFPSHIDRHVMERIRTTCCAFSSLLIQPRHYDNAGTPSMGSTDEDRD
jgi:hypothetical protein